MKVQMSMTFLVPVAYRERLAVIVNLVRDFIYFLIPELRDVMASPVNVSYRILSEHADQEGDVLDSPEDPG